VTRLVHYPAKKFAIGTVDDFLNIDSSMCDAATESLSLFSTYPVSIVSCELACQLFEVTVDSLSVGFILDQSIES